MERQICCCLEGYEYGVNERLDGKGLLWQLATKRTVSK